MIRSLLLLLSAASLLLASDYEYYIIHNHNAQVLLEIGIVPTFGMNSDDGGGYNENTYQYDSPDKKFDLGDYADFSLTPIRARATWIIHYGFGIRALYQYSEMTPNNTPFSFPSEALIQRHEYGGGVRIGPMFNIGYWKSIYAYTGLRKVNYISSGFNVEPESQPYNQVKDEMQLDLSLGTYFQVDTYSIDFDVSYAKRKFRWENKNSYQPTGEADEFSFGISIGYVFGGELIDKEFED